MPFLFQIERRSHRDSPESRLAREDDFLDEHGGRGARLTYRSFDAVAELAIRIGALFSTLGR